MAEFPCHVSSQTAFCDRGQRKEEAQGLFLHGGRAWRFYSFKGRMDMLSSLLLQKYLLAEEDDKEQLSAVWTRRPVVKVTLSVHASKQACCLPQLQKGGRASGWNREISNRSASKCLSIQILVSVLQCSLKTWIFDIFC